MAALSQLVEGRSFDRALRQIAWAVSICVVSLCVGAAAGLGAARYVAAGSIVIAALATAIVRPTIVYAALIAAYILADDDVDSPLRLPELYAPTHGVPPIVLIVVAIAVIQLAILRYRTRFGKGGAAFIALLAVACLTGFAVGIHSGAEPSEAVHDATGLVVLSVAAWVTSSAIRTRGTLERVFQLVVTLVVLRAIAALLLWAAGIGTPLRGDAVVITTSLDPATNWLRALVLLALLAAALSRTRRPPSHWLLGVSAAVIVGASLFLSYRRSFLLGLILGVAVIVVLFAIRQPSRRPLLLLALVVGGPMILFGLQSFQGDSSFSRQSGDAYRVAERRNVENALRLQPISGLGFAVPWQQTVELPATITDGNYFVHFAFLWWWMKMGLLGALAYLAFMLGSLLVAVRLALSEDRLAFGGIVAVGSLMTLIVADVTASFTGVDTRFCFVAGGCVGLLLAANRLAVQSRGSIL